MSRIKALGLLLTVSFSSLMLSGPQATSSGAAIIYPAPSGESPSPLYEVSVTDRGGTHRSFVYFERARKVTTPGNHGTHLQSGRSFSWTTFETDGPVKVRVVRKRGSFKSVQLRPSRFGLSPSFLDRNTIQFTVNPGQKISVEFDKAMGKCYFDNVDCVRDILMIFADRKTPTSPVAGYRDADTFRPLPGNYATNAKIFGKAVPVVSTLGNAQGKKAVVFGPGVYDIGYWRVPNNIDHIHFEGGAIVYGAIDVLPLGPEPASDDYLKPQTLRLRPEFKLTGHGILSGRKIPWSTTKDFEYCPDGCWWSLIKLAQLAVANVTVSDITFADSPQEAFTFANGADPRTAGRMEGFKVVAQWTYSGNGAWTPARGTIRDCFVQANADIFSVSNSGASVSNCTIWQFGNGAAFQFGWYGKTISGLDVAEIDQIHSENWWAPSENSGFVNYAHSQSGARAGEIRDVVFRNIHLEGKNLRLIGLNPQSGQKINGMRFTNVAIESWQHDLWSPERTNYLNGINGGSVDGVEFRNVRIGGRPITAANAFDLARIEAAGDVSNVEFYPGQ